MAKGLVFGAAQSLRASGVLVQPSGIFRHRGAKFWSVAMDGGRLQEEMLQIEIDDNLRSSATRTLRHMSAEVTDQNIRLVASLRKMQGELTGKALKDVRVSKAMFMQWQKHITVGNKTSTKFWLVPKANLPNAENDPKWQDSLSGFDAEGHGRWGGCSSKRWAWPNNRRRGSNLNKK